MIHEVVADWQILDDGNALLLKVFSWSDTGEHQELRRVDGAGRHDDLLTSDDLELAAIAHEFDAVCGFGLRVNKNFGHHAAFLDVEITAVADRMKVGSRCAATGTVSHADLQETEEVFVRSWCCGRIRSVIMVEIQTH